MPSIVLAMTTLSLAVALGSCASPSTQRQANEAKAAFDELNTIAGSGVDADLIDKGRLSKDEIDKSVTVALEKSAPTCSEIYPKKFAREMQSAVNTYQAYGVRDGITSLPVTAAAYDVVFDECLAKFGLTGKFVIILRDGREWPIRDYVREFINRGLAYQQAGGQQNLETQRNRGVALFILAAVAGAGAAASSQQHASAYNGNCMYSWETAADGSRCGARAASVRHGGY